MTTTIIVLSILVPLALVAMKIDDWSRDLTTNRAVTDPDAEAPMMRPITQRFTIEGLDAVLAELCREEKAWSKPNEEKPLPGDTLIELTSADEPTAVRRLVHQTSLIGFRDDVWLVVEPAPADVNGGAEKLRLHIESRSRLGKGDLGQNPRNIQALNQALVSRLIVKAPPPEKR